MINAGALVRRRLWWAWVGIILALVMHLFLLLPAFADEASDAGTVPPQGEAGVPQAPSEINTQPVFLDGEFLFEVPGGSDLSAQERSSAIEQSLVPLVRSPDPVRVRIETFGTEPGDSPETGTPIIFADERYIMTVTTTDARVGRTQSPQAQARVWADIIDDTLESVRQARQAGLYLRAWVATLVTLAVAVGIHWGAGKLWHDWLPPMLSRLISWSDDVDGDVTGLRFLFHLSLFLVRVVVWLTAAAYIASLFPITRKIRYLVVSSIQDGLFSRNLPLGGRSYSLFDLLLLLAVLLGVVIAASAVTNLLRSRFLRMTGISVAAQEAIAILSKYTLILLGVVVILQLWGIDLSSIALIASGLGIGIGLGLQNIVKDFVSGLVLVFERPVQVGDFVDFGQVKGTVSRIGSRSTEIRTLDHVSIIVPNSRFLENEVINWSHGNPVSRIRLPVGVSYSANPEAVREALLEACQKDQHILKAPAPQVFFTGFGDSALEFELVVWIAQPSRQVIIRSDLYFAIEACLRRHAIEIPFPQRDLHIRSGHLPIEVSHEARRLLRQLSDLNDDKNGA